MELLSKEINKFNQDNPDSKLISEEVLRSLQKVIDLIMKAAGTVKS